MRIRSILNSRHFLEIAACVLLVSFAAVAGWKALLYWNGPALSITNDLFIPSVCYANGMGLVNIDPACSPELREFLDFKRPAFSPEALRGASPQVLELDPFQQYHRYLLYATGIVWRVFGVSWDAMKILIIALYAAAGLAAYYLFRLGMGRSLALLCSAAFLIAPATRDILPVVRDFGKAPFFLLLMLLAGRMVVRRNGPRGLIIRSLLLGVVLGIGLGFRRDLLLGVPVGLVAVFLAPLAGGMRMLPWRAAALSVLCAAFVVSGWPILTSFDKNGTMADHDLIMGFATNANEELGIRPASYERLYLLNDMFASTSAYSFESRTSNAVDLNNWNGPKRHYLIESVLTFPFDYLNRAYAAVLSALTGAPLDIFRPFALRPSLFKMSPLLRGAAVFIAIGLFVLLSVRRLSQAWMFFFIVVYFGAYTSLQYHPRHAFYLGVFFLWLWGTALAALGRRCYAWWLHDRVSRKPETSAGDSGRAVFLRCAGSVLLAAILLLAPWAVLRVYQAHILMPRLEQAYREASLTALPTQGIQIGDWTLFRTPSLQTQNPKWNDAGPWSIHTSYLAADFGVAPDCPRFRPAYYVARGGVDFSKIIALNRIGNPGGTLVRYFFPVYEYQQEYEANQFLGVMVPTSQKDQFKGLYLVENLDSFRLLPNLALPLDATPFRPVEGCAFPVPRRRFDCMLELNTDMPVLTPEIAQTAP